MAITRDEVARHAGVSPSTVSNVINNVPKVGEEVRQKVLKSIEKLSYVPNEAARKLSLYGQKGKQQSANRSYNIGCITFTKYERFSHPFFSKVLDGMEEEIINQGYNLLFVYSVSQLKRHLTLSSRINSENIDGMLILAPMEQGLLDIIRKRIRDIVCVNSLSLDDIDCIDADKFKAGYKAVEYLAGLGHRRIGFVGYPLDENDTKFKGYRNAVRDFNLESHEDIIEGGGHGDYGIEQGYQFMKRILERANPFSTAVFAASDMMAIGAMKAIRGKGLGIPEDISVIGYDDIGEAQYLTPPLTTIRIKKEEIGMLATRRLIERINTPDLEPIKMIIPVKLIVRGTCRQVKF